MHRNLQSITLSSDNGPLATSSDEAPPPCSSQSLKSDDLLLSESIDLDDVLDTSIFNHASLPLEHETMESALIPSTPTNHLRLNSLDRWDRIPVGTFRRTRETVVLESPDVESRHGNKFAGLGGMTGPDVTGHTRVTPRSKKSKGENKTMSFSPFQTPLQKAKSRRDYHKDTKKKLVIKNSPRRVQNQTHHRNHFPNSKSRGTASAQRTNFFATSSMTV